MWQRGWRLGSLGRTRARSCYDTRVRIEMRNATAALFFLALGACLDPAPAAPTAPEINGDGVRVLAGGREVVVHCALMCEAMTRELDRLAADCTNDVSSRPHLLSTSAGIITLGCCQEASTAYERGCGHESLAECMGGWASQCQGATVRMPTLDDPDRGVAPERGTAR